MATERSVVEAPKRRGRPMEVDLWADIVLDILLDGKHRRLPTIARRAKLTSTQTRRAIQYLRLSGIAVIEKRAQYFLSESSLHQALYALKRIRDMVSRAATTLGSVQIQDRHLDATYLRRLRRGLSRIQEDTEDTVEELDRALESIS